MKLYLLNILILFPLYAFGQFMNKDTVTTMVNWPIGLAEYNNTLFIAEGDDNEITKIDLSESNPTPEIVIGELDRPNYMAFYGSDLYFSEFSGGLISKINVDQSNPKKDTILMGLNSPRDLIFNGTDLYFSSRNMIQKIDITSTDPEPVTIISEAGSILELALSGNDLYYSEYDENTISKLDISESNPIPTLVISDLDLPLSGMTIKDSELYFSQYGVSEISKIDISTAEPTIVNIDVNVVIADLAFIGDDLYASDFQNSLILKYSNTALSTNTLATAPISIYPNPATDYITIEGLEDKLDGAIYNSLGAKIQAFSISDQTTIDIGNFAPGIYLLVFENGWTKRIIIT